MSPLLAADSASYRHDADVVCRRSQACPGACGLPSVEQENCHVRRPAGRAPAANSANRRFATNAARRA